MEKGMALGCAVGTFGSTLLILLAIPTINYIRGEGFKLLISRSGSEAEPCAVTDMKSNLTIGEPGTFEIYTDRKEENMDLKKHFSKDEFGLLNDLWRDITGAYWWMSVTKVFYRTSDDDGTVRFELSDGKKVKGNATVWDVYSETKNNPTGKFVFSNLARSEFDYLTNGYKVLKYRNDKLLTLIKKIGGYGYLSDAYLLDWNQIKATELIESLPFAGDLKG